MTGSYDDGLQYSPRGHAFLEAFGGANQDRATALSSSGKLTWPDERRDELDRVAGEATFSSILVSLEQHSVPFPFVRFAEQHQKTDGAANALFVLDPQLVFCHGS